MEGFATYLFFDLETSGLPIEENNKTKITEFSLVAVSKDHLLNTPSGSVPRVQHKITLCFNPGRFIQPGSSEATGLCNMLLEHQPYFKLEAFEIIDNFIKLLPQPVCLIAHNGFQFDFPILRRHLNTLGVKFSSKLMCADSLYAFHDILEARKSKQLINKILAQWGIEDSSELDPLDCCDKIPKTQTMQNINENTPKSSTVPTINPRKRCHNSTVSTSKPSNAKRTLFPDTNIENKAIESKVFRKFFWGCSQKPKDSYKLEEIYKRVFKCAPPCAHRAEYDCLISLHIAVALSKSFVDWLDEDFHTICLDEIAPLK